MSPLAVTTEGVACSSAVAMSVLLPWRRRATSASQRSVSTLMSSGTRSPMGSADGIGCALVCTGRASIVGSRRGRRVLVRLGRGGWRGGGGGGGGAGGRAGPGGGGEGGSAGGLHVPRLVR